MSELDASARALGASVVRDSLLCPSANPDVADLRIIGVVEHGVEGPRVAYLNESLPATPELLGMAAPLPPTAVFRLAGTCQTNRCPQFAANKCTLAARVIGMLPAVIDKVTNCQIRPNCRWFRQEGIDACLRCPQVVTTNYNPTTLLKKVIQIAPGGSHAEDLA
jgi:hypothetical protein